jgi:hypothetical protein
MTINASSLPGSLAICVLLLRRVFETNEDAVFVYNREVVHGLSDAIHVALSVVGSGVWDRFANGYIITLHYN